jgi:hypothetical protein
VRLDVRFSCDARARRGADWGVQVCERSAAGIVLAGALLGLVLVLVLVLCLMLVLGTD